MEIAARYPMILIENGLDPKEVDSQLEQFNWWLQATAPGLSKVKKNKLIDYPHLPARQVVQDLAHNYKKKNKDNASSSSGGSLARRDIPNALFSKVVSGVLEILKNNPDSYQKDLDAEQIESIANEALSLSDPEGRSQFSQLISQEVVHLVSDIVMDMFEKYKKALDDHESDAIFDESDFTDPDENTDAEDNHEGEDVAVEGREGEDAVVNDEEDVNGHDDEEEDSYDEDSGEEIESCNGDDDVGGN